MAALKAMVEDAFHNGQPRHGPALRVRLMCHSMGCNVVHTFLSRFVDQEWKDKYVSGLLALGPSWGGAAMVPANWVDGPIGGYINVPVTFGADVSGSWPAILALMPYQFNFSGTKAKPVWPADQILAQTTKRNYTVADMSEFLADAAAANLSMLGPDLFQSVAAVRGVVAPHVNLTCVYITDVDTPLGSKYPGDSNSALGGAPELLGQSEGDGTVNRNSAEVPCQNWRLEQTAHIVHLHPLQLGGVNHVGMLADDRVIQHVLRLVSGQEL